MAECKWKRSPHPVSESQSCSSETDNNPKTRAHGSLVGIASCMDHFTANLKSRQKRGTLVRLNDCSCLASFRVDTAETVVGVRVAEIQATWESIAWRYLPTSLNPADDLSRSIPVARVNGRWMKGPLFLKESPEAWPTEVIEPVTKVPEIKTIIDPSHFSNWQKLCRVTAYCLKIY